LCGAIGLQWHLSIQSVQQEDTMYQLDSVAYQAYLDGVGNDTIKDTEKEVVETILEQDVVSYCSERGCYTFDYDDLTEA